MRLEWPFNNNDHVIESIFNVHGAIVSVMEFFIYLERILIENKTFKHN
jgi:hypothetical protein